MVLLPISLDSGVLLSSPVSKMEPKRKRIRITNFSIWGCDFQKGQPTMKRSFATYIHACCSAVQRQHGEAFSSQPHDTNSITLSRHHVKWQWQAYCCSGAINYSVACIVNLHFQMIQTDSVQCHWARSSKLVKYCRLPGTVSLSDPNKMILSDPNTIIPQSQISTSACTWSYGA